MDTVHARVVQYDCTECRDALLVEEKNLGLPPQGEVIIIPKHWLTDTCPHGRSGFKFVLVADTGALPEAERADCCDDGFDTTDFKIDATKNIGYPVREHGPYGSHPTHDGFDDESGPNGSGTY